MDFHKIWEEQCAATRTIRERFGDLQPLFTKFREHLSQSR